MLLIAHPLQWLHTHTQWKAIEFDFVFNVEAGDELLTTTELLSSQCMYDGPATGMPIIQSL
jgi:hypothetical protein